MDGGKEDDDDAQRDQWWSDVFGEWEPSPRVVISTEPDAPSPREQAASARWPSRVVRRILRRPLPWARRPWPLERIIQGSLAAICLIVTTGIIMNVVHFNPFNLADDQIFDNNTPTGGDLGAHVWAPAYLRDALLPHWQLSGWSMDWYAGFPLYRFYMVIPALAIVALDTVLPYGEAFKLVSISGLVTLPLCCWAFGRLARFRAPVPELFAFAGLCFVLNESYSIYGGNLLSTMAGEFSFSIALSLMMLGLGLLARGLQDGRHLSLAALVLALACLCHGIVLIYTALAALVIVGCRLGADVWYIAREGSDTAKLIARRRAVYALGVGVLTVALSAFWVGPFLADHQYMTDMKYGFRPSGANDSFWDMFFDLPQPVDILVATLALAGLIGSILRRHVVGIAIGIVGLVAVLLVYETRSSLPVIGLLWNPRLLPLLYLMRWLMMMVGVVEVGTLAVNVIRRRDPVRLPGVMARSAMLLATALAVLLAFGWFYEVLPFGGHRDDGGHEMYAWGPLRKNYHTSSDHNSDVYYRARGSGWAAYNFAGYEGRKEYPEYYTLMQTMASIGNQDGCGRALWEVDNRKGVGNGKYGTTWALMLLPYWTDGCIASMEGLYFEASGTTPYHFLTAAAMSTNSSNPVRQLRYIDNDASVGVPEMQSLGVRYVMVTTHQAVEQADGQPELSPIAESGPWHIYRVADSDVVVPLTVQPVVVTGRGGDQRERHLEVGTSWFQHQDDWAAMPADDGPAEWQRIDVVVDDVVEQDNRVSVVQPVQAIEAHPLPAITVSNVDMGEQSVSFDVDQIGVPVLVKVSYFPNWQVDGAEGPYRIGPNQMVVIPTQTTVRLHYERSTSDSAFIIVTLMGAVAAVGVRFRAPVAIPPRRATITGAEI